MVAISLQQTSAALADSMQIKPAFTFGVISDVQWADADDGFNYARTVRRCFRGALQTLRVAVSWWNTLSPHPDFVAQLGDLIDGRNAGLGTSMSAMAQASALLEGAPCRVYNLVGNHELYNFDRAHLGDVLEVAPRPTRSEFHAFSPAPGWRVLALDSFQESVIGWPKDDPRHVRAQRMLAENNPNINPSDPGANGNWLVGIKGLRRRFVPYNGALGERQLEWLRGELEAAEREGQRVVILSHAILHPQACDGSTMVWDYAAALKAIRRSGCVVAVVCGHDHAGGVHRDQSGVLHLTLCSPLNKGAEGHAYGLLQFYDDRVELLGPRLADLLPLTQAERHGGVVLGEVQRQGVRCEAVRFPGIAARATRP